MLQLEQKMQENVWEIACIVCLQPKASQNVSIRYVFDIFFDEYH